jgi:cytochrome c biogenesis protein CcdA/thioredoxin-related protein
MKKLIVLFILLVQGFASFSQDDTLLHWKVNYKKVGDKTYQITASTTVPQGWKLYGNNKTANGETSIQFVTDFESDSLTGEPSFNKPVEKFTDPIFNNEQVNVFTGAIEITQQIIIKGTVPGNLKGTVEAFVGKDMDFKPQSFPYEVKLEGGIVADSSDTNLKIPPPFDEKHPLSQCGEKVESKGLLTVFFLGLVGGLIALLTPCMFPMIPVTVSFFTKRSPNHKQAVKNGSLYGFFIFLIYVLASLPFHILGNVQPEVFNNISTSPTLNIIFFAIFIVFAISFFGFFEITLPSSIAGKADSKSGLNSKGGIFFMALTLVIVSFSCTGIILGTLLVGTVGNGAWPLTVGMAGFGLALALPFALFAIFPNWLHKLPKSGGWLDTVKKVLAFVEVALALKFLSNADLVMQWGLLSRELFIILWIAISVGLTLYLFGWLRLPHDGPRHEIPIGRKLLGAVAILFGVYLTVGLVNSKNGSLKLLSGILPPTHGVGLQPNVVNDYQLALKLSREQHKPLLIDFTGYACTNCRRMEEYVWTDPDVYKIMKDSFIIVSLYVDGGVKLPVEKRFKANTKFGEKEIVTEGDKWATFQTENFSKSTQPLYAVLDSAQRLMSFPVGNTPKASDYLKWLQCSKKTYNEKNNK